MNEKLKHLPRIVLGEEGKPACKHEWGDSEISYFAGCLEYRCLKCGEIDLKECN